MRVARLSRISSWFSGSGKTGAYTYDGDGNRIKRVSTGSGGEARLYVYDAFGRLAAEYATNPPSGLGGTKFRTTDHLGSTRVTTDANGNVVARRDFFPFGERIQDNYNDRQQIAAYEPYAGFRQRFTAKERDDESELDYFLARYYSGRLGRFNSVDPDNAGATPSDPQSWNGYGYVRNQPTILVDPDGRVFNLATGAFGAGVGAVLGFGGSVIAQATGGESIDLKRATAAGVGGAVAGGFAGLTLGGSLVVQAVGAVGVGAVSNTAGGIVERGAASLDVENLSVDIQDVFDPEKIKADAKVGAVGGAVGRVVGSVARGTTAPLAPKPRITRPGPVKRFRAANEASKKTASQADAVGGAVVTNVGARVKEGIEQGNANRAEERRREQEEK